MKRILFVVLIANIYYTSQAQSSGRISRTQYFELYRDMAISEMQRSGVPASITLAQGALESGDGNSRLAVKANNHFGIKCHSDWTGRRILEDDDKKNECFRKYASAEESFRDHSDYLRTHQRYASLFDLKTTDYKGWARGLKKAGYATSSTYAHKLIEIIEAYDLHQYDEAPGKVAAAGKKTYSSSTAGSVRTIRENNRVKYVIAREGDTYESIADELGKLQWELPSYNDAVAADPIEPGETVYIQPKRRKAGAGNKTHILKQGETMYDVSQEYAVKLDRLYKMNNITSGTEPSAGTELQLRKAVKVSLPEIQTEPAPDDADDEEEIKVELNFD